VVQRLRIELDGAPGRLDGGIDLAEPGRRFRRQGVDVGSMGAEGELLGDKAP